jgi:membrane protein required for colicin V production
MNGVDLALAFLLAVCALRGYWRGFFRESFGVLALVGGMTAAFHFAAHGAAVLRQYLTLPTPVEAGAAFVLVFSVVHTAVNLMGILLDRLAGTRRRGITNALAGAALGVGKGAAVVAFVLLFLHLFPILPALDGQIMTSKIGSPLVSAAGSIIRSGVRPGPQPDSPSKA